MKIPSKLPASLSIRGGTGVVFSGGAFAYNYAIGGLPFLSAASNTDGGRWWLRRETAPFRKQQFDSAQNPGEQSLDGYWIRSVMSYHGGAGQLFADPVEGTTSSDIRFRASKGVCVWTPGALSLLYASRVGTDGITDAPAPVDLLSAKYGNSPGYISVSSTQVFQCTLDTGLAVRQSWPGGSTILSACTDGSRVFVHATDGVYRGTLATTSPPTTVTFTKIYTNTATSGKIAWVKDRLILGTDAKVYELSPDPSSPPASLPASPLYTAKASGWTWTDITETTAAIYAVGSSRNVSSILKFTLDTSGGLPTLTGGTIACQLPGGETALSAFGYLGTYLALGTSKGVRIAVADEQGNLTYGPLLWDNATPVYDFAARDHWIWCTYKDPDDTEIKVARIDLGLQVDTLRFAWATDLCVEDSADASDCTELVFGGDSNCLVYGTANKVWVEDIFGFPAPTLMKSGWLETSRVRFNTLEPKVFRAVRVRGPELQGSLNIAYIAPTGSVTPVYTYGVGDVPGNDDIGLTGDARDFLALKFTLNGNSAALYQVGAEMSAWQIKALPASPRQRLITLPLLCFDFEKDRNGVRTGGQGFAWARLMTLEDAESAGSVMTFQDLDNDASSMVFVESIEFQQESPPAHWKEPGAFGGRLLVTMRTV